MSKKNKAKKCEWKECTICSCVINDRDVTVHRDQCSADISFSLQKAVHGFIHNNVIYGVASPLNNAGNFTFIIMILTRIDEF